MRENRGAEKRPLLGNQTLPLGAKGKGSLEKRPTYVNRTATFTGNGGDGSTAPLDARMVERARIARIFPAGVIQNIAHNFAARLLLNMETGRYH